MTANGSQRQCRMTASPWGTVRLEFSGPPSHKRLAFFSFKLPKRGPENSKRIVGAAVLHRAPGVVGRGAGRATRAEAGAFSFPFLPSRKTVISLCPMIARRTV
jgi:hypothetical protein